MGVGRIVLIQLFAAGDGGKDVYKRQVQVDGLAQMGAAHGAALDVPAGAAGAVGRIPGGLAGLGRCV